MDRKRRIAVSLGLVGLAFVAALHTVLSFVFETGLEYVGAALLVLSLGGLLVVNLSGEPGNSTVD